MTTKTTMTIVSAMALALASCANGASTNVSPDVTSFTNGVLADVEAACQVEPVVADIALLFPIYGSNIASAANAICNAVAKAPKMATASATGAGGHMVRLGAPAVVVHGVTIHFQ